MPRCLHYTDGFNFETFTYWQSSWTTTQGKDGAGTHLPILPNK
ncbi:hypothetical protein PDIG_91310 [Penicillium digitatum PHI26]|uniref:Uncharacterized protein n=2 Tax=Penicillium digitatum TaxID=36651 RepID=K9F7N8_PEND2|nr:hypothetical protein PDIP_87390 [Penicillium digitatum Pd1]EKV04077.1 hypothetical protein PDIG_91310 [Penicillium digitatum PHI26]EKV04406.1 hypothetical protein PDIP_87390 [Penicillium digitatum Pd1]